jgi:hypothetical protein
VGQARKLSGRLFQTAAVVCLKPWEASSGVTRLIVRRLLEEDRVVRVGT